jgi:phosphoribosyl 1,2-cyclic phosphodiesterase
MVDCGRDWQSQLPRINPAAIVLTHAHPDHAGGLHRGACYPVFASTETWALIGHYPIPERVAVEPRSRFEVQGVHFEAFPVEHSVRAPAVGFRIETPHTAVFYAPDLVAIVDEQEALTDLDLYVGDGAAITRSIVRYRDGRAIGHASIRVQLDWCAAAGVRRAIFTHCGSEIVKGDTRATNTKVAELGAERQIEARVARDGLELELP